MINKIIYLLLSIVLFTSCVNEKNDEPCVDPFEKSTKRTVLIYIAGANSLGGMGGSFDLTDMDEMIDGISRVPSKDLLNANILVFHQRYIGHYNGGIAKREAGILYRLVKDLKTNRGEFIKLKQYKNTDLSTDPIFMGRVFQDVYSEYPSDSYGLVMWSHADGWLPGTPAPKTRWIGQDVYEGKAYYMDILDFKKALTKAPYLDFIHYDMCLMQTAEVAYEMRDEAHYAFGSPAEIPGPGSPYDQMIPVYFSSKKDIVLDLADTYYKFYEKTYTGTTSGNYPWKGGVSMSVFDLTKVSDFAKATRTLLDENLKGYETLTYLGVQYYDPRGSKPSYYSDIIDVLNKSGVNKSPLWTTAYSDFVVYFKTTPTNYSGVVRRDFSMRNAHGVSMYIPRDIPGYSDVNDYYRDLGWYKLFTE